MLHEPLRAVGRQSTFLHAVQHGGVSCMGVTNPSLALSGHARQFRAIPCNSVTIPPQGGGIARGGDYKGGGKVGHQPFTMPRRSLLVLLVVVTGDSTDGAWDKTWWHVTALRCGLALILTNVTIGIFIAPHHFFLCVPLLGLPSSLCQVVVLLLVVLADPTWTLTCRHVAAVVVHVHTVP